MSYYERNWIIQRSANQQDVFYLEELSLPSGDPELELVCWQSGDPDVPVVVFPGTVTPDIIESFLPYIGVFTQALLIVPSNAGPVKCRFPDNLSSISVLGFPGVTNVQFIQVQLRSASLNERSFHH